MRPDNMPLPNLPGALKVGWSALLLLGSVLFLGTWALALYEVYMDPGLRLEPLGAALGMLAEDHSLDFGRLFVLHLAGTVFLLASAGALYARTSVRRLSKRFIISSAAFLCGVDLLGWLNAPRCTSSNYFVASAGIVSCFFLLVLAITPFVQMWVYRRWPQGDAARPKRVVIVGGGFAGLYVAMGLNKLLGYHHGLEITLLDRRNYFLFPPLLPSTAAGTIETRQVTYPFRRIFETTNIVFRRVDVTAVSPEERVVRGCVETDPEPESGQPPMTMAEFPYDYLVIAPGSVTQTFNTAGVEEHAYFMRELNDAILLRNHVIDCFERAAALAEGGPPVREELLHFVIIGAGPTGIETATELHDLIDPILLRRYPEVPRGLPRVTIVQSGAHILPGWDEHVVQTTEEQLKRTGIVLKTNSRVKEVGAAHVTLGDGEVLCTRTAVWCAGVKPHPLLAACGLPLHATGRIAVGPELSVPGHPEIFVIGDAAYATDLKTGEPLPPLGQVAFQQGSFTAKNIGRLLFEQPAKPFHYFNFGSLVSVGEHFAAVKLLGVRLSGFVGWFVWRTLYLSKIVGASNKVRIIADWTLDLLFERSIAQIRDTPGK